MTHIKTTSDEEAKMRKDYPLVKSAEAVVAGEEELQIAKEIVALAQKSDECLLKVSELKAKLMKKMGDHAELRDGNGTLIASWISGGISSSIDYEAMIKEFKVPDEWIAKHTTKKAKSRTFKMEDLQ